MKSLLVQPYDQALHLVDKLIINPLELYGHHKFDEYDKKQLVDIVLDTVNNPNKFTQQLASDFGHYTKNWGIDWDWIAHHILCDFYNYRQATTILNMFGPNSLVIKQVEENASPICRKLYLTDPNNINSEPKVFKLSDLLTNGSNAGKAESDFKPVVGVTDFGYYEYHPYEDLEEEKEVAHYYDNSSISSKPSGSIWDEDKREYKFEVKPLTERHQRIRDMIKVTVTITDDDGNVVEYKDKEESLKATHQVDSHKTLKWWQKLLK